MSESACVWKSEIQQEYKIWDVLDRVPQVKQSIVDRLERAGRPPGRVGNIARATTTKRDMLYQVLQVVTTRTVVVAAVIVKNILDLVNHGLDQEKEREITIKSLRTLGLLGRDHDRCHRVDVLHHQNRLHSRV